MTASETPDAVQPAIPEEAVEALRGERSVIEAESLETIANEISGSVSDGFELNYGSKRG